MVERHSRPQKITTIQKRKTREGGKQTVIHVFDDNSLPGPTAMCGSLFTIIAKT